MFNDQNMLAKLDRNAQVQVTTPSQELIQHLYYEVPFFKRNVQVEPEQ